MKTIITLISLSLFSTISFAESIDFDYVDYKDLYFKTTEPGSYSWVNNCTSNNLFWNKETKSYKTTIENTSEKGVDIVEVSGNSIRTISHYESSDNAKTFSDTLMTFISENEFIKDSKRKTIFPDKTEFNRDVVSEGSYKNGKVVLSRWTVNGKDQPLNTSTSFMVWLDKEATETYLAYSFEPSGVKTDMADPSVDNVFVKSEIVCKSKTTKL